MSNRDPVQAVIGGILKGEILETFDRYYADEVVMSENGERVLQRQVSLQVWRDGRIARETFYHG